MAGTAGGPGVAGIVSGRAGSATVDRDARSETGGGTTSLPLPLETHLGGLSRAAPESS